MPDLPDFNLNPLNPNESFSLVRGTFPQQNNNFSQTRFYKNALITNIDRCGSCKKRIIDSVKIYNTRIKIQESNK
jgi:hypothetical protein